MKLYEIKMKKIVTFIFLGCLILVGCNDQPQLNKMKSDLQSEYITIDMYTPSGWILIIKRDGSGRVGFGSHLVDFADFEKNTFIFSDVMQKLESKLEPQGSIATEIAVNLWERDEASINVQYTSDKTSVDKFFQKALSAITNNKDRIEEIYKDKMPVSFE